jgi:hypothetical protein
VLKQRLHALPEFSADNRGMLAVVNLVLVLDPAQVRDVGKQLEQAGLGERQAATFVALAGRPALVEPAPPVEFLDRSRVPTRIPQLVIHAI